MSASAPASSATPSATRPLHLLGVRDIVQGIGAGAFTAIDVIDACMARIDARDGDIKAWAATDAATARAQAATGVATRGPLAGVPFGVKDVIDTASLPTRMGSPLYEAHRPLYDAGIVGQLRLGGGIVLGKTHTCEFAGTQPTHTVNPHAPAHTPGGSSSGSAAAVADFMVPLALGTQTGGSVLRPAAFCGIVGFKPSYGFYPIAGMKPAAHSFDTPGLFARAVGDIALVHSVLMNEPEAQPAGRKPRIGVFRTHLWDLVDAGAAANFERAIATLARQGASVQEVAAPQGFARITERRAVINAFERSRDLAGEWLADSASMGPLTQQISQRGLGVSGTDYAAARRDVEDFRTAAVQMFAAVDVIVTPVTPGEAPLGLANTGDPRLQELWTMLHTPSMAIPSGHGAGGLPLGLQLVGPRFGDHALLTHALWIEAQLQA